MAQSTRRTPRPPVVTIVVVILLVQVASIVTQLWLQLAGLGVTDPQTLGQILAAAWGQGDRWVDVVLSFGLLALVAASFFTAIGLAHMRAWAWLWAMTIQGVRLLIGVIAYFRGDPYSLSLLIPLIAVLLLDQEPVRRAFGVKGLSRA